MQRAVKAGLVVAALAVFAVALYRTAWQCDDAYITYRSVDNLVNGYGPVWNTTERVQAFTNPLWMFVNAVPYVFTREIYFTGLAVSALVTLLALLALAGTAQSAYAAAFGIIALAFSRAFVEYSTSGLENPLTHLLLAAFVFLALRREPGTRNIFLMALCAGLAMFNRMDTVLFYAPMLAYLLLRARSWPSIAAMAAGFAQFAAWEIFSVVYYGFPFPNTAYAKLGSGISQGELARQGINYLLDAWQHDPLTPALIAAGLATAPLLHRKAPAALLALGGALYVAYVVKVGGDFMQGRFLSAPLLLAMLLLVSIPMRVNIAAWAVAAGIAAFVGLRTPHAPIVLDMKFGGKTDIAQAADEREFYMQSTGLIHWERGVEMPKHFWAAQGRAYRKIDRPRWIEQGNIGFTGFFAGPKVHILDNLGLTDPLMARLPAWYDLQWRIGHFRRYVPNWYRERLNQRFNSAPQPLPADPADTFALLQQALINKRGAAMKASADTANGVDVNNDPDLQAYWDHLERIVRGPIWSLERWTSIVKLNLGLLDHLVRRDHYRFPWLTHKPLGEANGDAADWDSRPMNLLGQGGLQIDLGGARHEKQCVAAFYREDRYRLLFMRGDAAVAEIEVAPQLPEDAEQTVVTLELPARAAQGGYDAIRVFSTRNESYFGIASVVLKDE